MEMRAIDIVNMSNRNFITSVDVKLLHNTFVELDKLVNHTERLKGSDLEKPAESLLFKLNMKLLALRFFDGKYTKENYEELKATATKLSLVSQEKKYGKTQLLCENVSNYATQVYEIVRDIPQLLGRAGEGGGTVPLKIMQEVVGLLDAKLKSVIDLPSGKELFGPPPFVMIDVAAQIRSLLENHLTKLRDQCDKMQRAAAASLMNELATSIEQEYKDSFRYFPSMGLTNDTANTIVVCSPFLEEIALAVRGYARTTSAKVKIVHAGSLAGKLQENVSILFDVLLTQGFDCFVVGLDALSNQNERDFLFKKLAKFGQSGRKAFIADTRGNELLYEEISAAVRSDESLTLLNVTCKYLPMPRFGYVCDLLEGKDVITFAEREKIKSIPFMGYVGLNKALNAFDSGREWFPVASDVSASRTNLAQDYMRKLRNPLNFIDSDWGVENLSSYQQSQERTFDYDLIRSENRNNVRRIVESEYSLFAKCGLIARYCTLYGEDVSVWKTLSAEEKTARMTEATKGVSMLLRTMYNPVVEVIAKKDWKDDKAGGICCDGGKRIVYREDCVDDYEWAVKAICHECYHALQHTIISEGWRKWHWEELGLTANIAPELRANSANYFDVGTEGYEVEIMECGARAFEKDCYDQSAQVWHTINFD